MKATHIDQATLVSNKPKSLVPVDDETKLEKPMVPWLSANPVIRNQEQRQLI